MQKVFIGDNYYAIIKLPWEQIPILDSIQDDLSNGKAKLVIWYPMESMFYDINDFVINEELDLYDTNPIYRKDQEKIDALLSKYKIDDYILADNNPFNEKKYPNKCVYIPNFARWEFCEARDNRDAVFSSFNRRTTEPRLKIIDHIHKKDAFWSCGVIEDNQLTEYNHLKSLLPKTVDKDFTPIGEGMRVHGEKIPYWLYQKAYFHIINEANTWHDPNYLFISEKTYHCINSKTPFLLCGQPFTLKHLREIGFKTFNDYWDESYDEELNTDKRGDMICNVIDQIEVDYKKLFKDVQHILEHNYKHLENFDYSLESRLSSFGFK